MFRYLCLLTITRFIVDHLLCKTLNVVLLQRYMKYLYPYECEKRGLSSPGELQAAIDSNRREGRRQSFGSTVFSYSPVATPTLLSSPKLQMSHLSMPTQNSVHISQVPDIKKGNITSYSVWPIINNTEK